MDQDYLNNLEKYKHGYEKYRTKYLQTKEQSGGSIEALEKALANASAEADELKRQLSAKDAELGDLRKQAKRISDIEREHGIMKESHGAMVEELEDWNKNYENYVRGEADIKRKMSDARGILGSLKSDMATFELPPTVEFLKPEPRRSEAATRRVATPERREEDDNPSGIVTREVSR
jgi:chromosome segregation ATPase